MHSSFTVFQQKITVMNSIEMMVSSHLDFSKPMVLGTPPLLAGPFELTVFWNVWRSHSIGRRKLQRPAKEHKQQRGGFNLIHCQS